MAPEPDVTRKLIDMALTANGQPTETIGKPRAETAFRSLVRTPYEVFTAGLPRKPRT